MTKASVVFDASALLAFFHLEQGAERVEQSIRRDSVFMSAVNYAEVAVKHIQKGKELSSLQNTVRPLRITIVAFDEMMAEELGAMKPKTVKYGLSLADCACLTLAKRLNAVALTADAAWNNLKTDFNIELIRQTKVTTTPNQG